MAIRLSAMLLLTGVAACARPGSPEIPISAATGGDADRYRELIRMAHDVEEHGSHDTAFVLYRQAITVSGRSPAAYVELGEACQRSKKHTEAIEAYRAALAIDPEDARAQLGLGTALVQHGELQKGVSILTKAAPLVNTGAAYNRLGVAQTMAGKFLEAQDAFEKGLGVADGDLDIATNLALAAALAKNADKAAMLTSQIAASPAAKPVHRRNLVIVLGIIGMSAHDAQAVAPADLSQSEFNALIHRAASIRRIADPVARAHALGTLQG